jgi:hypothetical protein
VLKEVLVIQRKHSALVVLALCAHSAFAADADRWKDPKPGLPDLSVAFIERTPRYPGNEVRYRPIDQTPDGPKGDGLPVEWLSKGKQQWPRPGEIVTFTAHVMNVGAVECGRYDWHWLIDGKDVQGGWSETLTPGAERTYELRWRWKPGRHYVAFEVDRNRYIGQITHKNDFVVDATDALAFHFFVEQDVETWFRSHKNGLDSYSWWDWAQFQVREMNREFRDDIFPATPEGITVQVRLDKVTVLPNGFRDPGGTHAPIDNVTSGWDGVWGFTNGLMAKNDKGLNFYEANPQWLLGPEWPLHHELGHQLGQPDYYLLPVSKENNRALPGVPYDPPAWFDSQMMFSGNYYHDEQIGKGRGVWDSGHRFWGQHAARAFNRDATVRRGFFGTFLVDIPKANRFTFVDESLQPIVDARVEVYPAVSQGYGGAFFPAKPRFTGSTDAAGSWLLNRSPYDVVLNWTSNGALQFVVTPTTGPQRVGFLNITDFNLAYWRGHTKEAGYTVKTATVESLKR